MRASEIQERTDGDDAGRIDVVMRDVIVPFDMVEIDRISDACHLVQVLEITGEVRVIHDAPEAAFEMAMVDGIEPKQRDKQSPIGLDELWSEEITPVTKSDLEVVQRLEQPVGLPFIGLL